MSQQQEQLVKFCSADTAKQVLAEKKLRWSSPHLFNDPLELSYYTGLSFEKSELLPAAIKLASSLIFSRDTPKGETPLIAAISRWRESERFQSPEEAEGVLRELLEKMVDARFTYLDKVLTVWRNYNKKMRVCSFSASNTNPYAWQHFANKHNGVAITFNTDEYGSFKKCMPVIYNNTRPELTDIKEQLNAIVYQAKDKTVERFSQAFIHKAHFYKKEQEFRCIQESPNANIDDDPDTWFDDVKFERSEVSSICLGMALSEVDRAALLDNIKANFSAAKVYQASAAPNKYELELVKL